MTCADTLSACRCIAVGEHNLHRCDCGGSWVRTGPGPYDFHPVTMPQGMSATSALLLAIMGPLWPGDTWPDEEDDG